MFFFEFFYIPDHREFRKFQNIGNFHCFTIFFVLNEKLSDHESYIILKTIDENMFLIFLRIFVPSRHTSDQKNSNVMR